MFSPARTPRSLWIELTSKCPFDCVFCSRKTRRGAGEHLPFALYESLVRALVDPRRLVLNYSGESTVYPELIPAIRLAREVGAYVELVSALASAPESLLEPLSRSGLNRLTVSVHAVDPEQYEAIYRYSSFAALRTRLERFLNLCGSAPGAPVVDLAFVAMDRNLQQLQAIASFADTLGLAGIFIFPVIRRDEIPIRFPAELNDSGMVLPEFEQRLHAALTSVRRSHPELPITICNAPSSEGFQCIGEVPRPFAGVLPSGACVHSCEQNPWETAHVLSNGDVVACEVLDSIPLGNLCRQSIGEIWNGEPYKRFRQRYRQTEVPECRTCTWKTAYLPAALSSEIIAARGRSAQLVLGWHDPAGEPHVWSTQQALALIAPRSGAGTLHVSGVLPPPAACGDTNILTVRCNSAEVGRITNSSAEPMPFGVDFEVNGCSSPWHVEFRTRCVYRPAALGKGADQRDLGFALVLLAAKTVQPPAVIAGRKSTLAPLKHWIERVDRWAAVLPNVFLTGRPKPQRCSFQPGLSVVIPERKNIPELADCLSSVRESAARFREPLQVTVVVNGSSRAAYDALRHEHPFVEWQFHGRPLAFSDAVAAGLRTARFDWVYLLNNDVALHPDALRAAAAERHDSIFAVASQIVLKDSTRFREETNWTTLFLENGVAAIHDWIPASDQPMESFYAGGGASLFRRHALGSVLARRAYAPFYWEDVEWGWRARKLGFRTILCPSSLAHHRQRSTIRRFHPPEEIETVLLRNRFLFQLRNFTTLAPVEPVFEAIARAPEPVVRFFQSRDAFIQVACGRIWNYRAPVSDEEVMATWNCSCPPAPDC